MSKTTTVIKEIQNKEFELLLKEYQEYKILKKQIEDKLKDFEATIKNTLDVENTDYLACGPFTCKVSDVTRSSVDKDVLEKDFPDIYSKCLKTSSYKKLAVK